MLVDLNHLAGTAKVHRILHIFEYLRESCDLSSSDSIGVALDNVELFPCFLVELKVELLLAAHLLQLLILSLLHVLSQLVKQALVLNLSLNLRGMSPRKV